MLTGGVRTPSDALVGPVADAAMRSLHVDLLFMGVHGMDRVRGFTTPNLVEAETNRALIDSARQLVVVADHTKWGVVGLSTIAALEEADVLITDSRLPVPVQELLAERVHRLVLTDADEDAQADADIALSFVQRPEDVAEAEKIARGRAGVMAKIEKPQAVTRLAEIIESADALMVARGDLGVEMPLETVPGIQKQITRAARRAGKPVVVATQMLELMIAAPVPTRAEVSDVATAVFEGADAIMLSAESAAGAISGRGGGTMNRIAEGRKRSDLSRHHQCPALRAGSDRRRRHLAGRPRRSPRR